jgi:hypothetical protein
MFVAMGPYAPPPPQGAQTPPRWGDAAQTHALLGDRVIDVAARRHAVRIDGFDSPEAFRDYFKAHYGPTVAAYQALADVPDRAADLDRDLAGLARSHDRGTDTTVMDWEYLLLTARIRPDR